MNPMASAKKQRAASQLISAPLVDRVYNQNYHLDSCHSVQLSIKRRIQPKKHVKQNEDAKNIQHNLPATLKRSMELSQKKGTSTCLTALTIDEHSFALHKAALRDGWPLQMAGHSKTHQLLTTIQYQPRPDLQDRRLPSRKI